MLFRSLSFARVRVLRGLCQGFVGIACCCAAASCAEECGVGFTLFPDGECQPQLMPLRVEEGHPFPDHVAVPKVENEGDEWQSGGPAGRKRGPEFGANRRPAGRSLNAAGRQNVYSWLGLSS